MDYSEIQKLNQSLLKKILVSPRSFLNAEKKYKENKSSDEAHFIFGSVLDIMLTGTKQDFEEKYIIIPDKLKCTESVEIIIKSLFTLIGETDIPLSHEDNRKIILQQCNYHNYYGNRKDDTRIDSIISNGEEYFNFLKESLGKTIISSTDYNQAVACVMRLKQNPFTSKYCNKKTAPRTLEFLDKFIIEFEERGFEIKGELDRVFIDHSQQEIIPIDFKSVGKSINMFKYEFWKHRYDFQAATYMKGLVNHPKIKNLIENGYILKPFLFIVVESNLKNEPMIFSTTDKILSIGLLGGENSEGKFFEGLTQALIRYSYAKTNNAWDYPMEYYLNNGKIILE